MAKSSALNIYDANFPPSETYIATAGVTLSRWGRNDSSCYNWNLNVANLDFDRHFENYTWKGKGFAALCSGSFISSAVAAAGSPVMTIPMLKRVAKDSTSDSFSVKKYGAQCSTDSHRPNAGNVVQEIALRMSQLPLNSPYRQLPGVSR
jgi:hypothetical protein